MIRWARNFFADYRSRPDRFKSGVTFQDNFSCELARFFVHVPAFIYIRLTGMNYWLSSIRRILHRCIAFSTRSRYYNLFRFGYLNQLLADVAAFQHADKCRGCIFETLGDCLSIL